MRSVSRPAAAACLFVSALAAGCASAPPAGKGLHQTPPTLGRYPYSDADVDFMSGMIPHHAQARDHGRLGAVARRPQGRRHSLRAHRRRPARRDRDDADLAARSRPAGARRDVDAPQDEDERRRARDADAGHADRRGDGRARPRARAGVRPPVPRRHDQASPGRDRHGRRALQVVRRGAGRNRLQVRVTTSTPISRPRSIGWNKMLEDRPPSSEHVRACLSSVIASRIAYDVAASRSTADMRAAGPVAAFSRRSRPGAEPPRPRAARGRADRRRPRRRRPRPPPPRRRPPPTAVGDAARGIDARGRRAAAAPAPAARRPRHSAAATAAAARRHADAGHADRVGDRAVARIRASASRPAGGTPAQAAWNMRMISTTPPSGKVLGATHSDLAFSGKYAIQGQLQRLRDLRHLQSGEAGAGADVPVPGVAERRVGLQEPAVHVVRGDATAAPTAASAASPIRSARSACAASASSTSATSRSRSS